MLISARQLTKRFGATVALDRVDVEVPEGIVGLLGPNGAGKTTFLRLALGMETITSGEMRAFGFDCGREKLQVRSCVGFSPERECHIPGMTGVDTVYFAARLSGLPHSDALQRTHSVLQFAGLDEARYRRVQTYSTGMKQKVKLAQAIVHNPKLVILDEPTTGLDPAGREEILRIIRSLYHEEKISVLLSTHILHDVESTCDSAIVIHRGQVVARGSVEELKRGRETVYEVRATGDLERFASKLSAAGLKAEIASPERLRLIPAGELDSGVLFRAAAEAGCSVRHLARAVASLDEVFLSLVS